MKVHAWWINIWYEISCAQPELCCVLSYSQRLLRRTWPMLSWSWSSPIRLPEASLPALSMPRSSLRRTNYNSIFSPMVLFNTYHPSYLWNLGKKVLIFVFSHVPLCGGEPLSYDIPGAFREVWGSSPQKSRDHTLGQIFWDKFFLGLSPEGWGLVSENIEGDSLLSQTISWFHLLSLDFNFFNLNLLFFPYLWYQADSI